MNRLKKGDLVKIIGKSRGVSIDKCPYIKLGDIGYVEFYSSRGHYVVRGQYDRCYHFAEEDLIRKGIDII